ncbi:ATP-binding protein [Streptomyces sp. NPDC090127]|uniref:ATP-binding protein n=1 Tax=Streptomyces sp. NPDC090127 TaxID=3365953 RepID=UPI00381280D2
MDQDKPVMVVRRWRQTAGSVGRARAELRTALANWGMEGIEDDALLVLSELLTNAVRHGRVPGREVETRYIPSPDGLRIEVHDASGARPSMALHGEDATRGRGLPVVDVLAARWGVTPRIGAGKLVWAELAAEAPQGDAREFADYPR